MNFDFKSLLQYYETKKAEAFTNLKQADISKPLFKTKHTSQGKTLASESLREQSSSENSSKFSAAEDGRDPDDDNSDKEPVTVCLTYCKFSAVRRVCAKLKYELVAENTNWNFIWSDAPLSKEKCKTMKRFQRINHFPGMYEICRKDNLAKNLNRMKRLFPEDYTFFPKTWVLPEELHAAKKYSKCHKNVSFIIKPGNKAEGKGIFITKSLTGIKPFHHYICQVYLSDPLLIDDFKFDLRIYVLITSSNPLRIYRHTEGLVRLATTPYQEPTANNVSNILMHLTNYSVNKHSNTYSKDSKGSGSKRKLSWFNSHLAKNGHDVQKLWKDVDDVVIKTIISVHSVLKNTYEICFPDHNIFPACCDLLGLDILLDANMRPHLLEVNHSPSFGTKTPLDCNVKETVIEDTFRMMNLKYCDKNNVMLEDKKIILDRLSGAKKQYEPKNFDGYFQLEMVNRGGFRLIYPNHNETLYEKFVTQTPHPKYSSMSEIKEVEIKRDRFSAPTIRKKRSNHIPEFSIVRNSFRSQAVIDSEEKARKGLTMSKKCSGPLPDFAIVRNSFKPQAIIDSEEKARREKLKKRASLIESHGLIEHLYISLKRNGVLSPRDEKKYHSKVYKDNRGGMGDF